MKNNRLAAFAVVALMVAASAFAMMSVAEESSAADTQDLGSISVAPGEQKFVTLRINEAEYSAYGYKLEWYWATEANKDTPGSWSALNWYTYTSNGVTGGALDEHTQAFQDTGNALNGTTLQIDNSGNVPDGEYTLHITADGSTHDYVKIWIIAKITVTIKEGITKELSPVKYSASLGVQNVAAAGTVTIAPDVVECNVDQTVYQVMNATGATISKDAIWYATGLPEGLSMSENGTLMGQPTKVTDVDVVTVNVTIASGDNVFSGTFTVKVTSAQKDFNYVVYQGTQSESDTPNAPAYVFYSGAEVTIKVYNSSGGLNNPIKNAEVDCTYDGSAVTNHTAEDGTATLSVNGTGAYKVKVTSGNNVETFTIYVISELEVPHADIEGHGNL